MIMDTTKKRIYKYRWTEKGLIQHDHGDLQYIDRMLERIRHIPSLSSYKYGIRVYDVDAIIWSKHTYNAFMVENKTHMSMPRKDQEETYSIMDESLTNSRRWNWKGTYLIRYENTGPDDGLILIHKMIKDKFIPLPITFENEEDFFDWIKKLLDE